MATIRGARAKRALPLNHINAYMCRVRVQAILQRNCCNPSGSYRICLFYCDKICAPHAATESADYHSADEIVGVVNATLLAYSQVCYELALFLLLLLLFIVLFYAF